MAKADTWLAFYPGAYLANTLHLTRAQHGSYLLLILAAFKAGGALPDDDTELATIARCTPKEWAAERGKFAAFFTVADGAWMHDRVTAELSKAERMTEQRRVAGTASATARQRHGNGISTSVAPPLQRDRRPSESPPDNPSHGEISTVAASASASPDGPPRSQQLPDSAKWAARLDSFSPWLPYGNPMRGKWQATWGLSPDSAGLNPSIPAELLKAWRAKRDAALKEMAA